MKLLVNKPYDFRGFDVPDATAAIDWISFDRVNKQTELVIGIYRTANEADKRENRLDTVHLSYQGEKYDELLAQNPALYQGIVNGVFQIAAAVRSKIFTLEA
jgi:hypothetical protein